LAVAPKQYQGIPQPTGKTEAAVKRNAVKDPVATGIGSDGAAAPDFVGLSLREAVDKARAMQVNVRMHGNGFVVKQSPAPGVRWGSGEALLLKLEG
jgi:hypothetical protein